MSTQLPFASALRVALANADLTQREFAEKCNISPGFPPLLLASKRTPPLDKLAVMTRALKLTQGTPERIAFERAAYLSHAPEEVRQLVDSLEVKLTKCEQKGLRLHQIRVEMRQLLVSTGVQLPESIRDL
jgi:transcriptional regulator with XRE-family HTH domain